MGRIRLLFLAQVYQERYYDKILPQWRMVKMVCDPFIYEVGLWGTVGLLMAMWGGALGCLIWLYQTVARSRA